MALIMMKSLCVPVRYLPSQAFIGAPVDNFIDQRINPGPQAGDGAEVIRSGSPGRQGGLHAAADFGR